MPSISAYFSKRHKGLLITTTFLSFIYFLWEANSWKYAYVGDIWPFFEFAKRIIAENYAIYPFSFRGVYEQNSILASVYQAIFMDLFGQTNLAWRLSNIVLIFPLSYFIYRWLRLYFNWQTASLATILMQCSFYLCLFIKIPYINPQAFALFVLSLYLSARAGIYPTKQNGILLGLVLGISFYIYLGVLFPFLVWPYLLPLRKVTSIKHLLPFISALILTYLLCLSFILPELETITGPQSKTLFGREFSDTSQIITNIGNNLLVFYKAFPVIPTHFIPFAYMDMLSQLFSFLGTIVSFSLFKQSKFRYLVLTYLSTCIFLGLTNPYTMPPTSRGMFLLLFGFVFAGIGIMQLKKVTYVHAWVIFPVITIIIGLNIFLSQFAVFQKIGYTGMSLILQQLQLADMKDTNEVTLILSETRNINTYTRELPVMQQAFGIKNVTLSILRPYELACDSITKQKLLVFSYDKDSLEKLSQTKCEGKDINYSVMTTDILYY